jgi:hypothetical protein
MRDVVSTLIFHSDEGDGKIGSGRSTPRFVILLLYVIILPELH